MKHAALYITCLVTFSAIGNAGEKSGFCKDNVKVEEKTKCLERKYAYEDNELKKVYNRAFTNILNSDSKKLIKNYWKTSLKKAQDQWFKYRDKDCGDPVKYEHGGGVKGEQASLYCLIDKTMARAAELQSRYNTEQLPIRALPSQISQAAAAPVIYAKKAHPTAGANDGLCPATVKVSSSTDLESRGTHMYSSASLVDGNPATAWLANVSGKRTRSWAEFEVKSLTDDKTGSLTCSFQMINGFTSSESSWKESARVKEMTGYYNGRKAFVVNLIDTPDPQEFTFNSVQLLKDKSLETGDKVKFLVTNVFPGVKTQNAYISTLVPKCQ
ncbi:lysozyme inhibitor LprI family protein [Fibrobacterota bacterium]